VDDASLARRRRGPSRGCYYDDTPAGCGDRGEVRTSGDRGGEREPHHDDHGPSAAHHDHDYSSSSATTSVEHGDGRGLVVPGS